MEVNVESENREQEHECDLCEQITEMPHAMSQLEAFKNFAELCVAPWLPISTIRKPPTIGQTKRLLLAALRVWELNNGYHRQI